MTQSDTGDAPETSGTLADRGKLRLILRLAYTAGEAGRRHPAGWPRDRRIPAGRFVVRVEPGDRATGRNQRRWAMRVMVMVKATKDSEAGVMPTEQLLSEMGKYNEQLVDAGIMLAGEGLHPSSKGVRLRFSGASRTIVDGPFAETKELVAGFWIWRVDSMEHAIEWAKRCPNPMPGDSELEIRPVFEAEDFGEEFTPELREQEKRVWAKAEKLAKG
jgi:hypothetical protein